MKALTCEMCGSTNLLKQDGVFVCQSCGTKYSVEEAKKMMVEGTVSIKGTVMVDNSGSIANFLMMAKNAELASNHVEAESYCNKIIEITPQHPEAWFYKGKASGWQSTLANNRIEEAINCFTNALNFSAEADVEGMKSDIVVAVEDLCKALMSLAGNHFMEYPSQDNVALMLGIDATILGTASPLLSDCGAELDSFLKAVNEILNGAGVGAFENARNEYHRDEHPSEYDFNDFIAHGDNALEIMRLAVNSDNVEPADKIRYYKSMIVMQQNLIDACSYTFSDGYYQKEYSLNETAKKIRIDEIMGWHNSIKELDPNYTIPSRPSANSGGCYVATAVYGSYDCPQVWTLRRFRDYTLDESWYGQLFIKTYYAISPTLVDWFGGSNWFKAMWRRPLDRLVENLRSRGVEDTQYTDKY